MQIRSITQYYHTPLPPLLGILMMRVTYGWDSTLMAVVGQLWCSTGNLLLNSSKL